MSLRSCAHAFLAQMLAGARQHHVDQSYVALLEAQPAYDLSPVTKRIGAVLMGATLLASGLWLLPLLILLALYSM
jgi:hypothetical protein